MHIEQTGKKKMTDKKHRSGYRLWIIIGILILIPVLFVIAAVRFIPVRIRQSVEQSMSKLCEGPVVIDKLDLNLSGHLLLDKIRFYDKTERKWLSLENIEVKLTNWLSLNPVITEIEIERLNLEVFVSNGHFSLPLVISSEKPLKPDNRLNLHRLTIKETVIVLIDTKGSKTSYDNLDLSVVRIKNHEYKFLLNRISNRSPNTLFAEGKINLQDKDFIASLRMKHQFTQAEILPPLSPFKVLGVTKESNLNADLTIKGNYEEPNQLKSTGSIQLKDWVIKGEDQEVTGRFDTAIKINNEGISLENLVVRDANDFEWLSVNTFGIKLDNWPGTKPVLTEIDADGLELVTHLVNGRLELPFKPPSNKSNGLQSDHFNLKILQVQNASISLAEKPESKITCNYLSMQHAEIEGFYDITLIFSEHREPEPSVMLIRGFVNPASREISLSLDIDHNMTKKETTVVFAALGIPNISTEGKLIADVTVTGSLNEPLGLHSNGRVEFDNWNVFINDKIFANNLHTVARLNDQNINFEEISAEVYNGPVIGSVYLETEKNKLTKINGRFTGENISFIELTSLLSGQDKKAAKGSVTLNYSFATKSDNLQSLSADGQIILNDADITVIPVIPYIFNTLGLSKLDPLKLSDAECTFSMAGPLVKIQSAHIANPLGAIEIEPGGTIDLQTGQLDMYVIAVPLRQLDDLVRKAPVADIVFNLRDKLSRFYLRGHWSSPPAKLLTKTPIKDIKEGTIGFLQDVARNGGNFGQEMIKGFKALLSIGQSKKKSANN